MAGLLAHDGYEMVRSPDGADLVVINTCGFLSDARAESYGAIEEMLRLKRQGRLGRVIVSGCLAERDREALLERFPEIDQLLGVFARDEIALVCSPLSRKRARGVDRFAGPAGPSATVFRPAPAVRWRIPAGRGSR